MGDPPWVGYHFIDAACLADLPTCEETVRGPFGYFGYSAWSPDGKLFATEDGFHIKIVNTRGKPVRHIRLPQFIERFAWSPDGEWLAVSMSDWPEEPYANIYLVPVKGGKAVRLTQDDRNNYIAFWLVVP